MWAVRARNRVGGCALAGIFVLAIPAAAQMQVGDNLRMNLNGNVGFNYAGGMNQGQSDHAMGFAGNGQLTGNYYSPNFLNFNVDPFYNRVQSDSVFGSLTNTTGVTSNVNLFNGTHFPGSFSYNRILNGTSAFNVPGSDLGLAQHTNSQTLGIGWSALVPGLPTLSASYAMGKNTNNILGESGENSEKDRTLNLLSTYKWDGFNMTGQFLHRTMNATYGEVLQVGSLPVTTNSSSNSYGGTVQHALPLSGGFSVSYNHLGYGYNYEDSYTAKNSGSTSTVNGNASFHPTQKLATNFFANYNDSLLGVIPQPLLNSGTAVNVSTAQTFHSTVVGSNVFYQIFNCLGVSWEVNHQQQSFLGRTYSATQFGGSANFNIGRTILKGLSFSVGAVDTTQQAQNTGLGFVGNLNYDRKLLGWDVSGNFSYSQNVQTYLLIYTTSSYSYLASIRRRIGERKYFMAGYSGAHSGLSANSGTSSSAERIWTGFIFRGNSFNAYYNKSDGLAIFTPNGLVPIPPTLPPGVLPEQIFTTYNSKGWGLSAGTTPTKRLSLSFGFAKSNGSTINPAQSILANNTLMNAVMQYRVRKIFLNGGYTRLRQSVGTPGTPPLDVTTYYIGLSRWFNFF